MLTWNAKKELATTRKKLKHEKFLLNMLKSNSCVMCINEYHNGQNQDLKCDSDLWKEKYQPVLNLELGFRTIGLCKRHIRELGEMLLAEAERLEKEESEEKETENTEGNTEKETEKDISETDEDTSATQN